MEQQTIVVGLTGQTGAGKTLVSTLLANRGYPVIDADVVARQVVQKGKKCLVDLAIEFGIEILNSDGTLNRKRLGEMVFSDKKKRVRLNQITFPYIQEQIEETLEEMRAKGEAVVFLDAPTLFESGSDAFCDKVVSVIAPEEERFLRIVKRDGLSEEEASRRMSAQHGDDYYTSRSDFVIENGGGLSDLRVKVVEMLNFVGAPASQEAP